MHLRASVWWGLWRRRGATRAPRTRLVRIESWRAARAWASLAPESLLSPLQGVQTAAIRGSSARSYWRRVGSQTLRGAVGAVHRAHQAVGILSSFVARATLKQHLVHVLGQACFCCSQTVCCLCRHAPTSFTTGFALRPTSRRLGVSGAEFRRRTPDLAPAPARRPSTLPCCPRAPRRWYPARPRGKLRTVLLYGAAWTRAAGHAASAEVCRCSCGEAGADAGRSCDALTSQALCNAEHVMFGKPMAAVPDSSICTAVHPSLDEGLTWPLTVC